jgi:transposase
MKLKEHLTEAEILLKLKSQTHYEQYICWQIIYSVFKNPSIECKELSTASALPEWKIFRIVERYNKEGNSFNGLKERGGRRKATSYLTLEDEKQLLSRISDKALKGLILTYNDIKAEVEQRIGKPVSDDYIWDLFNRHGWKKKAPRPKHPLKDVAKGEEFKKNSKRIWLPPQQDLTTKISAQSNYFFKTKRALEG